MRQVRPGLWRYTIDPYVNPQLATDYNGKLITDPQLVDLAGRVDDYPPEPFEARMGTDRLTDEDILADLEAKIAAEEASSPLELSGDPGELSSGATGEGEG
jgi:hypothetical protein